ncbi:hypothetical protein PIB30_046834 [Stylosanthes scabra]|uniref:Uncharacterized protein n=1 Tax=Stylosanthes scabra TaxID=79078 RepID=A0ABU6VEY5_9FABA|nr:hypothetical protein [Stylosanthes scabra]
MLFLRLRRSTVYTDSERCKTPFLPLRCPLSSPSQPPSSSSLAALLSPESLPPLSLTDDLGLLVIIFAPVIDEQDLSSESVADPNFGLYFMQFEGPNATEVVDLREQVQNLTQSLETQGQVLQQHIDEVLSLKDILAERDAWAEEHLRRMEEMSWQMAAFYNPLRSRSSSAIVGGSSSSTAPPLPPRPPPRRPDHSPSVDDDVEYDDA